MVLPCIHSISLRLQINIEQLAIISFRWCSISITNRLKEKKILTEINKLLEKTSGLLAVQWREDKDTEKEKLFLIELKFERRQKFQWYAWLEKSQDL